MNLEKKHKIYIAGHRGMVGSALLSEFKRQKYLNLIYKSHSELDLCDAQQVSMFINKEKPDIVVICAAKVGGIYANDTFSAEFIYQNLAIEQNLIHHSWLEGVKRLLFLGSSCIYPKLAPQPLKEEYLLSGELEKTNEAYAIAKIAGLKMCEFYRKQYKVIYHSAMPTKLYGLGDNYHPTNSHVLPALIRRFYEAKINRDKKTTVWGTGKVKREFLFSSDLAKALIHLLKIENPPNLVNIGTGKDLTISQLAKLIKKIIGFDGEICFDTTKPDGTPQKLLDISQIKSIGWQPETNLEEGIKLAYQDFLENTAKK